MLDFGTFRTLYGEAKQCSDEERYIMERGWQDWMTDTDSAITTLRKIYAVARDGFPALLREYRSLRQLSDWLTVPYSTAQKWKAGTQEASEYVLMCLLYATLNSQNG